MRRSRPLPLWLLCSVVSLPLPAAAPRVELVDGPVPPLVERLGPLDDVTALAIGPAGRSVAVARALDAEGKRSSLRIHRQESAEPLTIPLRGSVRDLLFSPTGDTIYGILHRPAKRGEGAADLLEVDPLAGRATRVQRIPPTARGLSYWSEAGALLVACRDEVRTVLVPVLRSGALFRVPGDNLAVASLGGTSRVLLGREEEILLVDLRDAPGETGTPARASVAVPGPCVTLASSDDGSRALARLADGTVLEVTADPLRVRNAGRADSVASSAPRPPAGLPEPVVRPLPPLPRDAPADPVPEEPEPRARAEDARTAAPPLPSPPSATDPDAAPSAPSPPPRAEEPPPATQAPAPTPSSRPRDPDPPPSTSERPVAASRPQAPVPSPDAGPEDASFQIRGRLAGPAAARVVAVVLLGPNNLLREAARVAPASDGTWGARGLPPGRYRVQLDGGGRNVLLADPPFALVDLTDGAPIVAPDFHVRAAL